MNDQDRAWMNYSSGDMSGTERDIFNAGWRAALDQITADYEASLPDEVLAFRDHEKERDQ